MGNRGGEGGLGARGSKGEEGKFALLLLGPFAFIRRTSVSTTPCHPLTSSQLRSYKQPQFKQLRGFERERAAGTASMESGWAGPGAAGGWSSLVCCQPRGTARLPGQPLFQLQRVWGEPASSHGAVLPPSRYPGRPAASLPYQTPAELSTTAPRGAQPTQGHSHPTAVPGSTSSAQCDPQPRPGHRSRRQHPPSSEEWSLFLSSPRCGYSQSRFWLSPAFPQPRKPLFLARRLGSSSPVPAWTCSVLVQVGWDLVSFVWERFHKLGE